MNRFKAWLCGIAKVLWDFLFPLLKSKVGEFLQDDRVQAAARLAVREAAMEIGTGNTEKAVLALDVFKGELTAMGRVYFEHWAALAVEAAFQQLKSRGEVN